jgi:DNA-binding XRE family transcriptional regulator
MGHRTTAAGRGDNDARLREIERRLADLDGRVALLVDELAPPGSVTAGEMLRRRRRELNDTQATAAQRLGVNQSTVSKWERGERIGWDHVADVADYLGIPPVLVVASNP